jgi:hypothetical protein
MKILRSVGALWIAALLFSLAAWTAAILAISAIVTPARAEGVIPTPWGWRAAPCCRAAGFPGFQGRPPNAFLFGALAPAFWNEIVPQMLARIPPPYGPPPGYLGGAPVPPPSNALDQIEPNPRGITRAEVEAALIDWCASNPRAPLCRKLEVRP